MEEAHRKAAERKALATSPGGAAPRLRVMVVDDEVNTLVAIREILIMTFPGVEVVTVDRLSHGSGYEAVETFRRRLEDRPLYISFDVDCLDPAFAPGTGTPCCGGLTTREAFGLLRRFGGAAVCGADVVEVLPDRDVSGVTALAASHLLLEIIALSAV